MTAESHLEPGQKYDFSLVAQDFDNQTLKPQIPGYDSMREAVSTVIAHSIAMTEEGDLLDLGCSNGGVFTDLSRRYPLVVENIAKRGSALIGVDSEIDMIREAQSKIPGIAHEITNLYKSDIHDYVRKAQDRGQQFQTVSAVLSIQFTDPWARQSLIDDICSIIAPGGSFVLVEKIAYDNQAEANIAQLLYHAHKLTHGMSPKAIMIKDQAIDGYLVPQTDQQNIDMLKNAGFATVTRFWQHYCFAGYMALKGSHL